MKKLTIVAILFAFATVSFAQDKAAAPAKTDKKAKTEKKADKKADKKAETKAADKK